MLKVLGVGVLSLLLAACGPGARTEANADPPKAVRVAVARAVPADLSRELAISAEFRPFQEIDVHAKVAGYVKSIFVDVGDHVRQGQPLAVLEIPEMQAELARATAARRRSDAELERAQNELQRAQSAHTASHLTHERLAAVLQTRPNLVAQQEIDEADARDRGSEAAVAAARAALAAAVQQVQVSEADLAKVKTMSAYASITAPFSGVITRRYADTGAMIQAGTASQTQAMPLVRLSQNDLLRLVLPVPETIVPRIHIGTPIEVRVATLRRNFPGKVARFSGQVQFSTRTMETEVDVPNPKLVLMPGMFAQAMLTLDRRAAALAVPLQAISANDSHPTVMVVNGQNRLEERAVKLGLETPHRVEVLSGLAGGEMVVTGGRAQLKPGQLVEPVIAAAARLKEDR